MQLLEMQLQLLELEKEERVERKDIILRFDEVLILCCYHNTRINKVQVLYIYYATLQVKGNSFWKYYFTTRCISFLYIYWTSILYNVCLWSDWKFLLIFLWVQIGLALSHIIRWLSFFIYRHGIILLFFVEL